MAREILLTAALLALSSCKPAEPSRGGSMQKAFEALPHSPLCSQNLPMDWTSTWPVPTAKPGEYEVLFYALDRGAQDPSGLPRVRVTEPRGRAVFTEDSRVSVCTSTPVDLKPIEGERYAGAAMALDEEGFDAASAKLLQLTQAAASWYSKGKRPDKRTLAAYWAQFQFLAEPALLGAYYGINPSFWEWLRRENGQSLPAARP